MSKKIEWTPLIDDTLKTLVASGENITYEKVAVEMSRRFGLPFTKNGCIGRSHRLRMPPRPPRPVQPAKPRNHKRRIRNMSGRDGAAPSNERKLTIYQLRDGDCRWPEGKKPPYLYCGKPTEVGISWCREHHEIVHPQAKHDRT